MTSRILSAKTKVLDKKQFKCIALNCGWKSAFRMYAKTPQAQAWRLFVWLAELLQVQLKPCLPNSPLDPDRSNCHLQGRIEPVSSTTGIQQHISATVWGPPIHRGRRRSLLRNVPVCLLSFKADGKLKEVYAPAAPGRRQSTV